MDDIIRKLESTILELGSEIYALRGQVLKTQEQNHKLTKTVESLQRILDEKAVITTEEFELSVQVSEDGDRDSSMHVITSDEAPKKRLLN